MLPNTHASRLEQLAIPCVFMRGGSSRGAVILEDHLPPSGTLRNRILLSIYGSPDHRQIDGLGGADPLTSKVAIVAPSQSRSADVTYLFGQVSIHTPEIFFVGNCGNMLSAVAAFSVNEGLVKATEPTTTVRILAVNTDQLITAYVPTKAGQASILGDQEIAGVPGTGAPIRLDFGDCAGALTGKLLPTGHLRENIHLPNHGPIEVSIIDAATTFVYVRADSLSVSSTISPDEIDSDSRLRNDLEFIRSVAAERCGLVNEAALATSLSPSVPRVTLIGPPQTFTDSLGRQLQPKHMSLVARQMSMQRPHRAYAVTNAICTAIAAAIPGTLVSDVVGSPVRGPLYIAHPAGIMEAEAKVELMRKGERETIVVHSATVTRTARRLMKGVVYVPITVLDELPAN